MRSDIWQKQIIATIYLHYVGADIPKVYIPKVYIYICIYLDIQKLHFLWSGLKGSERPKIEQMLILPSVNHIWKDQTYDAK